MTMMTPQQLECPECNHKQEAIVWETVNVSLHPELKERLYNGELNIFECQQCEIKSFIETPLLYHDMEQRFCVLYVPEDMLEDESFYSDFTREGTYHTSVMQPSMVEISPYLFTPHIVFNIDEMVKYIFFRERLAALNTHPAMNNGHGAHQFKKVRKTAN